MYILIYILIYSNNYPYLIFVFLSIVLYLCYIACNACIEHHNYTTELQSLISPHHYRLQ